MAVYTEVSDEDLQAFMAEYDLGAVTSCKGIAEGVENTNYLLQTDTGSYILTLYEKRVAAADLPFFIDLMEHLASRGLACPTPLHGRDGRTLRQLCGRPAAIVTFLQGLWPRRVATEHCAAVGGALAELHRAGEDFDGRRVNALGAQAWRALFDSASARADEIKAGLVKLIGVELDWLAAHWPKALPTGVIHADLFPDNVFFQDHHVSGLIDFYFACTDFLAYDLAICLNAWCFEADGSFNATKARLLVAGYQRTRPMSEVEFAALPILARGAAMRFLLTRLYDWLNTPPGAMVKRKDPMEYERKLRFFAQTAQPGDLGLAFADMAGRA
jgi:homoserine kinase type II